MAVAEFGKLGSTLGRIACGTPSSCTPPFERSRIRTPIDCGDLGVLVHGRYCAGCFPISWEQGHSTVSEPLPITLPSPSAEPAFATSIAVHTAPSASISSDRNQPYGMLQGAAPDNGPGESHRFSVPSNDLVALQEPIMSRLAEGLLSIGSDEAHAEGVRLRGVQAHLDVAADETLQQ